MAFRREDVRAGSEMTQLRLSSYPHMLPQAAEEGAADASSLQAREMLGSQESPSPWVAMPVPHVSYQTTQGTTKTPFFSPCCCLVLGRGCETRCPQNNPEPTSCSHVVGMGSGLILSSPVVGHQIRSLRDHQWAAGYRWVMLANSIPFPAPRRSSVPAAGTSLFPEGRELSWH